MATTEKTATNTTTSKTSVIDVSLDGNAENIEKLVEFSKKISEQEMTIKSLETDKSNYESEIAKYKEDIARLQKVIADNFIATTEKPKEEIPKTRSFSDDYKDFIKQNSKKE